VKVGDTVKVDWKYEERKRLVALEALAGAHDEGK